jgi:hypothetical protein
MTMVASFDHAELERAIEKLTKLEPMRPDEAELVQRTAGELREMWERLAPAEREVGVETLDEFERRAQALWAQGLRGEELVRVLGGGEDPEGVVLRTPEELEAYFGRDECASSI